MVAYLPAEERIEIIRQYAHEYGIRVFVETGTANGDTVAALLKEFDVVVTVELDPQLCYNAQERFATAASVSVILGDSGDYLTRNAHLFAQPVIFWLDGHYCTDEQTEIFTQRGWLRWDEVVVGDKSLAINPDTRKSEWKTIELIYRDNRVKTPMILMEGKSFSACTTPEHKWLTTNWSDDPYRFRTTESLRTGDLIPLTAPRADNLREPFYDDEFVEMVAWYYTEGNLHKGGITIGQSQKENPKCVDRIEHCLEKLFGPPRSRGKTWSINRACSDHQMARFYLAKPVAKIFIEIAPDKVPSMRFLRLLTDEQLELFIKVSLDGDGTRGQKISFTQNHEGRTKAFEAACALAGYATSTSFEESNGQWHTTMRTAQKTGPIKAATLTDKMKIEKISYTGVVWCPTLEHHNWLARRKGRVYFTGNCGGARGEIDTPIREELTAALKAPEGSVILIDDARLFGGMPEHTEEFKDYPSVGWVRLMAESHGRSFLLMDDIMRITPT